MEEILNLAYKEIVKSGYEDILAAGIVLTGGTSIMDGITELAEHVFNTPVRIGYPKGVGGLTDVVNSPMYATGVGLIIYGSHDPSKGSNGDGNIFSKTTRKLKKWCLEFF